MIKFFENKKWSLPVLESIGLILMILSLLMVCWYADDYIDVSQYTFQFPLVVAFSLIFMKNLSMFKAGILSWIAYFIYDYGIIEDIFHNYLKQKGVFALMGYKGTIVPGITIFLFYFVVLLFLGIHLFRKKTRTPGRTFSFLSSLGTCLVTLALHEAIPKTTFVREQAMIRDFLVSLIKVTPQKELPNVCKEFELECHFGIPESSVSTVFKDKMQANLIKMNLYVLKYPKIPIPSFFALRPINDEATREIYALKRSQSPNSFDLFIERKMANKSEDVNEAAFSKIMAISNLVWGWLFLIVGILHTYPIRKKVWITET